MHSFKQASAFLNHIGIAVENASALGRLKQLFALLGLASDPNLTEAVSDQGVMTHFVPLPAHATNLEFLEVTDPEGTVAQFLKKRGPGIHHLSFELPKGSLVPISEKIKAQGFKLIYPEPKMGAHSMRVNFIHPKDAGGILVEIMERS